ncbi:MAG: hypothetical protein ACI9OJ_001243 [Myxococcota bacterium]|jgi:hypothetical protein
MLSKPYSTNLRTSLVSVAALLLAAGCTEVLENYPTGGCEPDSIRCNGQLVERCAADGSSYAFFKTCNTDSTCTTAAPYCEGTGPACSTDAECVAVIGDIGDCREVTCHTGQCVVSTIATGTTCDDGNACTEGESCGNGFCVGELVTCDDDDQCTTDTCDSETGCASALADGAVCDDKKPCTVDDLCGSDGTCAGQAKECTGANACLNYACEQTTGECVSMAKGGGCDDGDMCTDSDICVAGNCQGTPAFECTLDTDCAACGSSDPCAGSVICLEGFCKTDPATAFECSNEGLGPCQLRQCVAVDGDPTCEVISAADSSQCDDGSACTAGDVCMSGACLGTLDNSVPGCGSFRIGWSVFSSGFETMTNNEFQLEATAGAPTIFGTSVGEAVGNNFRIRAIGPGGAQQ